MLRSPEQEFTRPHKLQQWMLRTIREESISFLVALRVVCPSVYGLKIVSKAMNRLPGRRCWSTNRKEAGERSKVSCSQWPWSSNLFTSRVCACVCACVYERERKRGAWHDNNMNHVLCKHTHTLAKVPLSIPD